MANDVKEYPVSFSIDYKDSYNRLTTFFRLFTIIPISIVYFSLVWTTNIILLPILIMILFRKKYPKWWFDFNLALTQFGARITSYALFLTDEYPSTDEEQSVHLSFEYPDAENDLNQFLPLVKWFLAIPHFIILILLMIVSLAISVIAWFAILITTKYPAGLFNLQVGIWRWGYRVNAYAFLLITDQYPPFSLE
jgi:hypothetical protein